MGGSSKVTLPQDIIRGKKGPPTVVELCERLLACGEPYFEAEPNGSRLGIGLDAEEMLQVDDGFQLYRFRICGYARCVSELFARTRNGTPADIRSRRR